MAVLAILKVQLRPSKRKPVGAARVELFVESVPPGEPVPRYPGESATSGGRPWYLRSYTTTPINVMPPIGVPAAGGCGASGSLPQPMLVVYWGRWADATGEVGQWSQPVVAKVETCGGGMLRLAG